MKWVQEIPPSTKQFYIFIEKLPFCIWGKHQRGISVCVIQTKYSISTVYVKHHYKLSGFSSL